MEMTEKEIKANYASAKNKARQIKILADLNCCRPVDIKKIVGIATEEKKQEKSNMEKMKAALQLNQEEPKAEPEQRKIPDSIIALASFRLDELEATISKAQKEYEEIAEFLGMGSKR